MKRIVCFAALVASVSSYAQELWGGAQYGMSEDQVSAAVVDTKPAAPNRLGNGAVAKLQKDGVEIASEQFTAQFYFLDDKLDQVMLFVPKGRSYQQVSVAADQIKDALTSKYGAPLRCEKHAGNVMRGYSCHWAKDGGNVRLLLLGIEDGTPTLNIAYQARLAKDAAKL